jgi:hypothetical protein
MDMITKLTAMIHHFTKSNKTGTQISLYNDQTQKPEVKVIHHLPMVPKVLIKETFATSDLH